MRMMATTVRRIMANEKGSGGIATARHFEAMRFVR
jgi:hypothetical protein